MGVIYFRGKEQTAGTSVYDLAVAGGFKGTQEEFYQTLATIKQKANATDVYTKADTYTKAEIDNAINTHKIDIDSALKQYGQKSISTTLSASKWDSSNKTYSFEADYPAAQYNVDISIDGDSCTDEQISAWGKAQFVGSSSGNKLKATKEIPTVDIPVILIASKK